MSVCVRVCVCACIERHMWYLFCYLKRKPNVPMCRSACGPKNSSLSSCHTQAVRLTLTLHFLTYVWHITETKNDKEMRMWKRLPKWTFQRCVQMQCELLQLSVLQVCGDIRGHSTSPWPLYALALFISSYVCTFSFVFNMISSSDVSRTIHQQHVLWGSSISYTFCPKVWPKSTPHLQL